MKFMGYNIQDNEVFHSWPRDSSSSEDEDEEEEEDDEEAPPADVGGQEVPLEADVHVEEPHPESMDTTSTDRGRAATFSTEFERRME